jgi:hypothetical protein
MSTGGGTAFPRVHRRVRDYAQQHGTSASFRCAFAPSEHTSAHARPLMTFENMPRLRLSSTEPLMDFDHEHPTE